MTNKRPEKPQVVFKIIEKSYKKKIKKNNGAQSPIKLNSEWWNWKNTSLKKEWETNSNESLKPELISWIYNLS